MGTGSTLLSSEKLKENKPHRHVPISLEEYMRLKEKNSR